jgi:hypothetical protein
MPSNRIRWTITTETMSDKAICTGLITKLNKIVLLIVLRKSGSDKTKLKFSHPVYTAGINPPGNAV